MLVVLRFYVLENENSYRINFKTTVIIKESLLMHETWKLKRNEY